MRRITGTEIAEMWGGWEELRRLNAETLEANRRRDVERARGVIGVEVYRFWDAVGAAAVLNGCGEALVSHGLYFQGLRAELEGAFGEREVDEWKERLEEEWYWGGD